MFYKEILNQVKEIILKYANPERIYIFGSFAHGEFSQSSDIDIAYDDSSFHENPLIQAEADKIDTLVKIDIKNIAHTDKRFRSRVISTGKVIYSHSKMLRFEDSLFNFNQALSRFSIALDDKAELEEKGFGEYFADISIKRFEFTFEMAWKTIKRYLDHVGLDCRSPRYCLKEAFAQGLIDDENIWLEMLEARNISSHIYDENEISEITSRFKEYLNSFNVLKKKLDLNKKATLSGEDPIRSPL